MHILFEYQNKVNYGTTAATDELEQALQGIWQQRHYSPLYWNRALVATQQDSSQQPFLTIFRNNFIQARHYVGIIQQENVEQTIYLIPKLFYQKELTPSYSFIQHSYQHLLWWMSYTRKIQLPFTLGGVDTHIQSNIVEMLIYLFARYTNDLLKQQIYHTYQQKQTSLPYLKGRLLLKNYVQQMATAQAQHISCSYAAYEKDNLLNQIIKSVSHDLLLLAKQPYTQQLLTEVINQLQDVSTRFIQLADTERLQLPTLATEWQMVANYCKLFLANTTLLSARHELPVFTFLLPMEQLFEEFVFGFLQEHFPKWQPQFQDHSAYLAKDATGKDVFQLRHDIVLTDERGQLKIIDCKYKQLERFKDGRIKGIDQKDMYQIAAYAVRRACKEVYLIYPKIATDLNENAEKQATYFDITDEFSQQLIRVWVAQLTIGVAYDSGSEQMNWQEQITDCLQKQLEQLLA